VITLLLWRILSPLFLLAVIILLVTQVVLPPFIGKRFFWIFRESERNLRESEGILIEATTKKEADEIKRQAKEVKKHR